MLCKSKVKEGHEAPDFTLPDQSGRSVRLSDYKGKSWVILYFYPKDNTRHCIVESSSFRDNYELFRKSGAEIIGVSSDDTDSHVQFAAEYKLPFLLLSDTKNTVRKLYGVPATFGVIPGRVTFIIDPQGIVRRVISSQFNPKSHVTQAIQTLGIGQPA